MPVLVTGIHVFFLPPENTWTPGTSPGVTTMGRVPVAEDSFALR